jgi:hypothetical protein
MVILAKIYAQLFPQQGYRSYCASAQNQRKTGRTLEKPALSAA